MSLSIFSKKGRNKTGNLKIIKTCSFLAFILLYFNASSVSSLAEESSGQAFEKNQKAVQAKAEPAKAESAITEQVKAEQASEADARKLFAAEISPAGEPARAIGEANCGCLAGAAKLSDSKYVQVMRPSRNRNWGHPNMIDYIEKLSERAHTLGWQGLLVGDLSMPRGGPMPSGHASHQRGTDVDIWLTPAPDHKLTSDAKEKLDASSVLKLDSAELDPALWTPAHADFVRAAAKDDRVARIFVTPAIKKFLCSCKDPSGQDAVWLRRLRPWEGHDDHIHVRLKCPEGNPCVEQEAPPEGDGCGEELSEWLEKTAKDPPHKSKPRAEESLYKPVPVPMSKMPKECQELLKSAPESNQVPK